MYILGAWICELYIFSHYNGCVPIGFNLLFAFYQAIKLLTYIDKNKAFSELSVKALKNIKYCANTISAIYVVIVPFLYPIADADDTPGLVAFPLIIIFGAMVIEVFAAVLQRLLYDAIEMKSEDELTI